MKGSHATAARSQVIAGMRKGTGRLRGSIRTRSGLGTVGAYGLSDENGCQVRINLLLAFDIFPFYLFFFLMSDCITFQNPRTGNGCLEIFTFSLLSARAWKNASTLGLALIFSSQLDVGRRLYREF